MTNRRTCVLSYAGIPIATAADRERLEEYKAERKYTAEQQQHMTITEGIPVLR